MQRVTRRQAVVGMGAVGLGLVAGCGQWPRQADAPTKAARVAYMGVPARFESFREGLRELGYVEGQNLAVETRWTTGEGLERYVAVAEELVRLQPDVLVATTTPQTQAARQATSTIPIVFAAVSDPVGVGFVNSHGRPGGNITGQSDFFAGLSGKRLELLKDTVLGVARVAALWNPTNPATALEWTNMQEASRALGVEVLSLAVENRDDLAGAIERLMHARVDALVILSDGLFSLANTPQLPELLRLSRVPTMHYARDGVLAGLLMSYGPNLDSLYRHAAIYVDKILKGAKPAELPVEQPREFDFVINLRTAQALGLTIPPAVLLQATEVIQ